MKTIRYKIIPEYQLLAIHDALAARRRRSLFPGPIDAYEEAWNIMAETLGISEVRDGAIVWARARLQPEPALQIVASTDTKSQNIEGA
jgi:hypothetical protein